ncbi:MAG: hypothetical protein ACTSU3_06800 [Candidatus Thorarchaeota archaeon]
MSDEKGSRLYLASVFVFMGFIMTLGMLVETLFNPEGGQYHTAMNIQDIIDQIAASASTVIQFQLAGVVFDTFFIIGYISIFYGVFLLTKNRDELFPKLGFIFGISTGILDLIENAIHVALLTGIPNGWTPDSLLFANLWTLTFTKDFTSYMAGMIFIILLLVTLNNPPKIRGYKLVLLILLVLYVLTGSIAVVEPSFFIIRDLSFMIDMGLTAFILYRISKTYDDLEG